MVGTECQCAFAQVSQTLRRCKQQKVNSLSLIHTRFQRFTCVWCSVTTHLCQSDHEEIVGVFGVILCQLTQHGGQSGVICAWENRKESVKSAMDVNTTSTSWWGALCITEYDKCITNVQFNFSDKALKHLYKDLGISDLQRFQQM